MRQAFRTIRAALLFVMNILGTLLLPAHNPSNEVSPEGRPLITVSPVRARVLCPHCLGENDERFQFCQWCGEPQTARDSSNPNAPFQVDEDAISERFSEFREMWDAKASQKSTSATSVKFGKFLASRTSGRILTMQEARPEDVVQYLCWLDTCGPLRRTIVHAPAL